MPENFEIAGGSIIGRDHIQTSKNNQDAYYYENNEHYCLGIVTDGCSNAQYSEVGAQLAVRTLAKAIRMHYKILNMENGNLMFFDLIKNKLLSQIDITSSLMTYDKQPQIINEYFLFTIIGFIIYNDKVHYFWAGDGVIIKYGEISGIQDLIINQDNEPRYIAYSLTKNREKYKPELEYRTVILTDDLKSIIVGSDGIKNLYEAANETLPGKEELVGDISQFWTEDKYFNNKFAIERRLRLINTPKQHHDENGNFYMAKGKLPDDTTLVVCRRKYNV